MQGETARLADIVTRRTPAEQATLVADRRDADQRRRQPRRRARRPDRAARRAGAAARRRDAGIPAGQEAVLRECIVNLARVKEALGHARRADQRRGRARRRARARARHQGRPADARQDARGRDHAPHRRSRRGAAAARAASRATPSTSTGWRTRSSASSTTWRRCRPAAATPGTCSTTRRPACVALDAHACPRCRRSAGACCHGALRAGATRARAPRAPLDAGRADAARRRSRRGAATHRSGAPRAVHRGGAAKRSRRSAACSRSGSRTRWTECADARAPLVPHAQGQRPHGRRATHRRVRLGGREPAQPRDRRARSSARRHARDAARGGRAPAGDWSTNSKPAGRRKSQASPSSRARVEAHTAGQRRRPPRKRSRRSQPPEPTLVAQGARAGRSRPGAWQALAASRRPRSCARAEAPADDRLARPARGLCREAAIRRCTTSTRRKSQSHLAVIRAYLRHAWLAVGRTRSPRSSTAPATRCGQLADGRGSATASGSPSRWTWLRKLFDHGVGLRRGRPRCAGGLRRRLEDVIAASTRTPASSRTSTGCVRRIAQLDAALEQRLAEEPPQLAISQDIAVAPPAPPPPPELPPPEAPPRSRSSRCCPAAAPRRARARRARRAAEDPVHDRHRGQAAVPRIRGTPPRQPARRRGARAAVTRRRLRSGSRRDLQRGGDRAARGRRARARRAATWIAAATASR